MSDVDQQSVVALTIQDKSVLYGAYMSFLRNGGLFVPTARTYRLGDEVFLLLTLMDEPEKLPVAGRVVWITPEGAQGNRQAGIGIEFSDEDASITAKIENYLAGSLTSDRVTHTLRFAKKHVQKSGPRGARSHRLLGVVRSRAHQRTHSPGTWDTRCRQAS